LRIAKDMRLEVVARQAWGGFPRRERKRVVEESREWWNGKWV
jgi:hypothetical protein